MMCVRHAGGLPKLKTVLEEQTEIERQRRSLRRQLKCAVEEEDYRVAAGLRDALLELDAKDPVYQLSCQLREAVAEERYEEAALLRDQLEEVCMLISRFATLKN